jgi:hypothetical protein
MKKVVLKTKFLRGILDNKAKTKEIKQSNDKYGSDDMNRDELIINIIATNLANGFIDCRKPRLPLISSTSTNDSAQATKSLKDFGKPIFN